MSIEKNTRFEIPMSRTGYGFTTIVIESETPITLKEAEERALDEAGDHLYNEESSEYELTNGSQVQDEPPTWDVGDTVGATFHLMGRFEVPRVAVPLTVADGSVVGFTLPNGKAYKIQVTIEECDDDEDNYRDLGTCELEALGVVGFGELDERDVRIEDGEG